MNRSGCHCSNRLWQVPILPLNAGFRAPAQEAIKNPDGIRHPGFCHWQCDVGLGRLALKNQREYD
jgi:hypothetical protein